MKSGPYCSLLASSGQHSSRVRGVVKPDRARNYGQLIENEYLYSVETQAKAFDQISIQQRSEQHEREAVADAHSVCEYGHGHTWESVA